MEGGRPPVRPRRLEAASPSTTRSRSRRAHERQHGDQAGAIILGTGGLILEQAALVDTGGKQRIALQIRGLAI
jgi:hypothetical protein